MGFGEFSDFLAPLGLAIAGLLMKFSKNKEQFGSIKKYWLFFIVLGVFIFSFRLFKYL